MSQTMLMYIRHDKSLCVGAKEKNDALTGEGDSYHGPYLLLCFTVTRCGVIGGTFRRRSMGAVYRGTWLLRHAGGRSPKRYNTLHP